MKSLATALLLLFGLLAVTEAAPPESTTLLAQQPLSVSESAPKAKSSKKAAAPKGLAGRPSREFSSALGEAAERAYDSGEISRWDLAKVRFVIRRHPEAVKEMEECCLAQAAEEGVAGATSGAIDWMALIDKLIEWLPKMLELIFSFL